MGYTRGMPEGYYAILLLISIGALVALIVPVAVQLRAMRALPEQLAVVLDEKHRSMLVDLHEGLGKQTDRIVAALGESSERVRHVVTHELGQNGSSWNSRRHPSCGWWSGAMTRRDEVKPV